MMLGRQVAGHGVHHGTVVGLMLVPHLAISLVMLRDSVAIGDRLPRLQLALLGALARTQARALAVQRVIIAGATAVRAQATP
jgi:hypothetical protein